MKGETVQIAESQGAISCQLVRIAAELHDLKLVAHASVIDPTILADFRSAVDHARSTAWAVQHCLRKEHDEVDVHPVLVRERIRRVMELFEALTKDFTSSQVKADRAARELLCKAAKDMCDHLKNGSH